MDTDYCRMYIRYVKSSLSSLTLACCLHVFYYGLLSMCRMSKTDHIKNIILSCFSLVN